MDAVYLCMVGIGLSYLVMVIYVALWGGDDNE